MFRSGLLDINQHKSKWWCAKEILAEVYRYKINSKLDNTSPKFAYYCDKLIIHETVTFGCDIYPISSYSKLLDDRKQ